MNRPTKFCPLDLHISIPLDTGSSVCARRLRGSSYLLKVSYGMLVKYIVSRYIHIDRSDLTLAWVAYSCFRVRGSLRQALMFHSFKRMLSPCPPGRPGLLHLRLEGRCQFRPVPSHWRLAWQVSTTSVLACKSVRSPRRSSAAFANPQPNHPPGPCGLLAAWSRGVAAESCPVAPDS